MKNKLFNRAGNNTDKSLRIKLLRHRMLLYVQKGLIKPYTQAQYFRLYTLENWYIRQELLEKVRRIDEQFNFNNMQA